MFRNKFEWYCAYFSTKEDAEKAIAGEMQWFKQKNNSNEWSISETVQQRPLGWTASIVATKENLE